MIKLKMLCTHCGKVRTYVIKDYIDNNMACKVCHKEGELKVKGGIYNEL